MTTLQEYRKREHWSFSAINQFVNICSLQFAFDRVYRLEREFVSANLPFGSAFHRVGEYFNLTRKEQQTLKPKEAADLFNTVWHRGLGEDRNVRFDEGQDANSLALLGMNMAACLVESVDLTEQVLGVNEAFAVPLIGSDKRAMDRPLIGEIDVRVKNGRREFLTDLKTSGQRWPKDKADHDLQPTVYVLGYSLDTGTILPFRFDVCVKHKTPVMEQHTTRRTRDDFKRLVHLIETVDKMTKAEHFLPSSQSFFCKGCPHQRACKAWHRKRSRLISVAA